MRKLQGALAVLLAALLIGAAGCGSGDSMPSSTGEAASGGETTQASPASDSGVAKTGKGVNRGDNGKGTGHDAADDKGGRGSKGDGDAGADDSGGKGSAAGSTANPPKGVPTTVAGACREQGSACQVARAPGSTAQKPGRCPTSMTRAQCRAAAEAVEASDGKSETLEPGECPASMGKADCEAAMKTAYETFH